MPLKYIPLTIVLISFTIQACAQELSHEVINRNRIKRPVVKLGISHIINFSEALIPIGLEYRFNNLLAVNAEVGIPLFFNAISYKPSGESQKHLRTDIKYRADLRFYFISKDGSLPDADNAGFIGLDASLRQQSYAIKNGRYYSSNIHTYSSADIDKSVQTYNIIVGLQANLSKHLFVELFSGLGVKLITIHRTNIIDDINTHDESPWITLPTGIGEDRIDEQGGTINIPFSIKLCYTL